MNRYKSSYGGIETIVGVFPKNEVEHKYNVILPMKKVEGKVMDIFCDRREILAYMVDDDRVELRVVNR